MKTTMLLTTLACGLLSLDGLAHGGQYRGPEDTVPPDAGRGPGRGSGGGPRGPTTPGPAAPGQPAPPRGGDSGGSRGGVPGAGPTTGRSYSIPEDFGTWQYWWEFNKDAYLDLKRHVFAGSVATGSIDVEVGRGADIAVTVSARPSATDLTTRVIPALLAGLDAPESNRDVVSSCMVALAKIGRDRRFLPLVAKKLASPDQEIRETAAIALGISTLPEALDVLVDLAQDSVSGRKLAGRANVDARSRAFACYGCGLVAHATSDLEVKRRVFATMTTLLDDARVTRGDIMIAALQAIGLLRGSGTSGGKDLDADVTAYLTAFMEREDKDASAVVRAHAVTALARFVGREANAAIKARFVTLLHGASSAWIQQSATLALGVVATKDDADVCEALRESLIKAKDPQVKAFSAIALGQVGGAANRDCLRKAMAKSKSPMKAWTALGLAILVDTERRQGSALGTQRSIVSDLLREYRDAADPEIAAGIAIALGITRDRDAENDVFDGLLRFRKNAASAGYHAVALGMMGSQGLKSDLRLLLERSVRDDVLFSRCAIALGLLGDKAVALDLVRRLHDEDNTVAVASSLSQALGFVGDRRSLDGLVSIVRDHRRPNIPRAFAAVALGLIGDKEDLPWNSKIAANINYRANVPTLTDGSSGVLDIL